MDKKIIGGPFNGMLDVITAVVTNLFGNRALFSGRQYFQGLDWGGWFQGDLNALCLLRTLFLQLHLRSSDIN